MLSSYLITPLETTSSWLEITRKVVPLSREEVAPGGVDGEGLAPGRILGPSLGCSISSRAGQAVTQREDWSLSLGSSFLTFVSASERPCRDLWGQAPGRGSGGEGGKEGKPLVRGAGVGAAV